MITPDFWLLAISILKAQRQRLSPLLSWEIKDLSLGRLRWFAFFSTCSGKRKLSKETVCRNLHKGLFESWLSTSYTYLQRNSTKPDKGWQEVDQFPELANDVKTFEKGFIWGWEDLIVSRLSKDLWKAYVYLWTT